MVARSGSVTQEDLLELTEQLNGTMNDLKNKFGEIDQKFGIVEHRVVTMESIVAARLKDAEETLGTVLAHTKDHAAKLEFLNGSHQGLEHTIEQIESSLQHVIGNSAAEVSRACSIVEGYRAAMEQMQGNTAELQRLMGLAEQSCLMTHGRLDKLEGAPREGRSKDPDILDPKNLKVDTFLGGKKDFDKWRESVEIYVSRFFPQVDKVMTFLRRNEVPITLEDFKLAAMSADVNVNTLKWDFETLQKDAGVFIKGKLGPDPLGAISAAGEGFLNMYAQLNQEFDKLGDETEGQLFADFAKMAGRSAKTLAETKVNIREFEARLKEMRKRLGREPDVSLKSSILVAVLDPQTKRDFVKQKILSNYAEMRKELTNLFCHGLDGGAVPMDCDSIAKSQQDQAGQYDQQFVCGPCENQPGAMGLNAFGKGGPLKCWNCDGDGHPARLCPHPLKPEIAAKIAEKGFGKGGPNTGKGYTAKGSWNSNTAKGGWNSKGSKGKGKDGKGGKGKGKTGIYSIADSAQWWDQQAYVGWYPEQWDPAATPTGDAKPLNALTQFNSIRRVKSINSVSIVKEVETSNSFSGLSEDGEEDAVESEDRVDGEEDAVESEDRVEPTHTAELSPNDWPCLPVRSCNKEDLARYVKERNTPKRLTSEEWKIAHDRVAEMRAQIAENEKKEKKKKLIRSFFFPENEKKEKQKYKERNSMEKAPARAIDTLNRLREHTDLLAVSPEQWCELRLTVDSGAGESVIPESEAANVEVTEGERTGCKYEVANGAVIYNKGEKHCAMVTQDTAVPREMKLQVSDVHKGLLSVIEMIDAGQRVVFDSEWSYIQDKKTGACDSLIRNDDAFELVTWVKSATRVKDQGFARQGR